MQGILFIAGCEPPSYSRRLTPQSRRPLEYDTRGSWESAGEPWPQAAVLHFHLDHHLHGLCPNHFHQIQPTVTFTGEYTRTTSRLKLAEMLDEKFTEEKDRPSMSTDPLAWERSWERDFKRVFSSRAYTHGSFSDMCPPEMVHMFASDFSLVLVAQNKQHLCGLQSSFTKRVAKACALEDFENGWREMPRVLRDDVILQAICRVMEPLNTDIERIWCPDSTVSHLSSNNGETFLTMMKQLLVKGDAVPHKEMEPRYIPHPIIDRLCALTETEQSKPGYRSYSTYTKVTRARILTRIMLEAVHIFVRLPYTVQHPNIPNAPSPPKGLFARGVPCHSRW